MKEKPFSKKRKRDGSGDTAKSPVSAIGPLSSLVDQGFPPVDTRSVTSDDGGFSFPACVRPYYSYSFTDKGDKERVTDRYKRVDNLLETRIRASSVRSIFIPLMKKTTGSYISQLRHEGFEIPRNVSSGDVKTRCPECSDSRRKSWEKCCSVNVDEGVWNCHHCGFSGSVNGNTDMGGNLAVKRKSPRRVNEEPDEPDSIDESKLADEMPDDAIQALEEKRGIEQQSIEEFDVRYKDEPGEKYAKTQFPYYYDGELINIKTRMTGKRFRMVPKADLVLWNIDSIKQDRPVLITEGELDALSAHTAGLEMPATSVPNGANKQGSNLKWLNRCREELERASQFYIAADDDEAGHVLRDELSRRLDRARCRIVDYPDDCNDLNDVLQEHGKEKVRECVNDASPYPIDGMIQVNDVEDQLKELYDEGFDPGVSTGWPNVDQKYRVKPGQLSIVTGVPTNGKSTFIDNLIVNLAKNHEWKVAVCSPEHWPPHHHAARMMAKWARKPFHDQYDGRMNEDEFEYYMNRLNEHIFYITSDSQRDISPDSIIDTAQQALFRYGINGLLLDPWNGLQHETEGGEMSTSYISNQLEAFRKFARVHECHVWIIAHPKKMQEGEVPGMYDISGSATWYDKADCGLSIEKRSEGETRVHVKKIKFAEVGEEGIADLEFIEGSEHLEYNPGN